MPNQVKARASLRIFGDDLDPSEVTRRLRLPPDHTHRRGDLRIGRSRRGKVIEYDPYSSGMWSMNSRAWVDSPRVETHVRWILDEIEPRADALRAILADGARADIFCYSLGRTEAPPALPRELRARARALGLAIGIDHYESRTSNRQPLEVDEDAKRGSHDAEEEDDRGPEDPWTRAAPVQRHRT